MNAVGYWFYWLFLYTAVGVLAALFGAMTASSFVYNYDHSHHLAHYFDTVNTWEWMVAILCAAPASFCIGLCQFWDYRKKQAILAEHKEAGIDDDSVWPPPPKSN